MKIKVMHVNQLGDKGEIIKLTKGGLRVRFYKRYLGRGL